jgi:hypothetical protein
MAELLVTATAKLDDAALATLICDWAGTGERLHARGRGEAQPVVAELGQEGRGEQVPQAGQGVKDEVVWMLNEETL